MLQAISKPIFNSPTVTVSVIVLRPKPVDGHSARKILMYFLCQLITHWNETVKWDSHSFIHVSKYWL